MTARNAANLALGVALGTLIFGASGYSNHELALLTAGCVGVLLSGIWRLRQ